MIELYAITDDPAPRLPADGLSTVCCAGLVALCAPASEREVTLDALWRHEEIVEAWMRDCDLLPVRFGTQVRDGNDVARLLAERRDTFVAALERVRGSVELSVRVVGPGHAAAELPEAESGAGYIRATMQLEAEQEDAAARVHDPLARLARAARILGRSIGTELLRAAYLVERGAVASFAERVAQLDEDNADLRLLCTGPWPPYSFVAR